ncbi:MAG: hypothetical protein AAF515_05005 [Pseudomonadota bacterium]
MELAMIRYLAGLLLLVAASANAKDPFECVAPEYRHAFLTYMGDGKTEYTTDLPAGFPKLSLPEGMTLLGSNNNPHFTSAVYMSPDPADGLLEKTIKSLEGDGWISGESRSNARMGGFQTPSLPRRSMVCRDSSPGTIIVAVKEHPDYSTTSFTIYPNQKKQRCQKSESPTDQELRRSLRSEIPYLQLPAAAKSSGYSTGGSNDEYSTQTVVTTVVPRATFLSLLGDQIEQQGWDSDANWSGNSSAGSTWTKSSKEFGRLVGILRSISLGDGEFDVSFTATVAAAETY